MTAGILKSNQKQTYKGLHISDKEIYQAVINVIDAGENIKVNGGDDIDNNGPIEPHPTWCNILKAVSMIGKYTNDLNDPLAQKNEALLGTFTRQLCLEETRAMKDAVLTDFFKKS